MRALLYGTPIFLFIAGLSFYSFGVHRGVWSYTAVAELALIAKASTWAICLLLFVIFAVDRLAGVPRSVPVIQWFVLVVMLSLPRLAYRFAKRRAVHGRSHAALAGAPETPVLVYGCGPMASLFVYAVQSTPGVRLRVVGIVDDLGFSCGRRVHDVPVLGRARDLGRVLAELAVHGVEPRRLVITCGAADLTEDAAAEIEVARARYALEVEHLPDILGLRAAATAATPWEESSTSPYLRLRRLIDAAVSAAALLAVAPVIAIAAAAVLADIGPPVLFRQVRPGRHMRPFTLYKFRTMRAAYDESGAPLDDEERTSAVGRLLRRTRLDELPQLYNVLIGDMAFIGPRPLLPRDLPENFTGRATIRPGITGWAQVNGGHRLTAAEKAALDAWYIRHAGFSIDMRIVYMTIKMMIIGERVDNEKVKRAVAAHNSEKCWWDHEENLTQSDPQDRSAITGFGGL